MVRETGLGPEVPPFGLHPSGTDRRLEGDGATPAVIHASRPTSGTIEAKQPDAR